MGFEWGWLKALLAEKWSGWAFSQFELGFEASQPAKVARQIPQQPLEIRALCRPFDPIRIYAAHPEREAAGLCGRMGQPSGSLARACWRPAVSLQAANGSSASYNNNNNNRA